MEEAVYSVVSALWRELSGMLIIAIGFLALRGGRARPRGALPFALFCFAWGAQIMLGNAVTLTSSPELAAALFLAFVAAALPVGYLLVEFAAAQSHVSARHPGWRAGRFAAALVASLGALLLALEPRLFLESATTEGGRLAIVRGWLFIPVMIVPMFIGFGAALVALHVSKRASPTPRTALRARTLLGGLGVYVAFIAGWSTSYYAAVAAEFGTASSVAYLALFAGLAACVITIAIVALRDARLARTPSERRRDLFLAAVLLAPLGWGAFEAMLFLGPLPRFSTLGLWRVAGMLIVATGLAQWRLPDLPQRATRAAVAGAGTSAAAATGAITFGAASLLTLGMTAAISLTLVAFAFTLVPGLRLAKRIFDRASPRGVNHDALYGQRVDAYRAAVEASLARGTLEEDEDFLAALRERFGITDSEDRLLRHYASACILVPRHGDATAAYDRLRLLGEGGAGRTWLARDRVRDRLVVLKEPLERWQREPGLRETVLREARLASRVRHPNVIRVEEVIEHRGAPIIVMEFAEGGSLSDLLRRRGVLPWHEALELALPVLRGVEAIHQAGIVHRDLKPSNVLLTLDGEPKIADFGIATAARASQASASNARTVVDGATFVGTLAYLAPEVRAGAPGDKRSDVYACAAMLHEMLYGSPPGLDQPVLANNDVPEPLTRTLARALSPDPAPRPASARALAEDLTSLLARARRQ